MNDCFVEAGTELQRTQVAPEVEAFTFAQIASHTGVAKTSENLSVEYSRANRHLLQKSAVQHSNANGPSFQTNRSALILVEG